MDCLPLRQVRTALGTLVQPGCVAQLTLVQHHQFFAMSQAALADTRVPAVEVLYGEAGDGDPELELDDDPAACLRLDTSAVPVILTLSRVSQWWTAFARRPEVYPHLTLVRVHIGLGPHPE